ncbi:MAG: Crp/Fnr family transcriptional regulator [Ginsengibacter sp.]
MKEWLPAISAHKQNFQYKKGEVLFNEGDKVTGIYFIYRGTVKVHKHWGKEKELIVRFAKKGDIVGHRGLGKNDVFPISATTLEPVTVCFVDINFFYTSLNVNHDFIFRLMMFYAGELQESEKNMRNLAHMPVKGRIANALLTLADKFGINNQGFIDILLSRQDLASFAGTTYETVFRILNEFIEAKIIAISGKNILIKNFEELAEVSKKENL